MKNRVLGKNVLDHVEDHDNQAEYKIEHQVKDSFLWEQLSKYCWWSEKKLICKPKHKSHKEPRHEDKIKNGVDNEENTIRVVVALGPLIRHYHDAQLKYINMENFDQNRNDI